jgi:hypothetical protein
MAKKQLLRELNLTLTQIQGSLDSIATWRRDGLWVGSDDVKNFRHLIPEFDKRYKAAQAHVASYEKGWSALKGKVNPKLAAARKTFKSALDTAWGSGQNFKDVIKDVDDNSY